MKVYVENKDDDTVYVKVYINGKKVDTEKVKSGDKEYMGRMKVEKGVYTVKIRWKDPDTNKIYSNSKNVNVENKDIEVTAISAISAIPTVIEVMKLK